MLLRGDSWSLGKLQKLFMPLWIVFVQATLFSVLHQTKYKWAAQWSKLEPIKFQALILYAQ